MNPCERCQVWWCREEWPGSKAVSGGSVLQSVCAAKPVRWNFGTWFRIGLMGDGGKWPTTNVVDADARCQNGAMGRRARCTQLHGGIQTSLASSVSGMGVICSTSPRCSWQHSS